MAMTMKEAAATGSRRIALEALRDKLAAAIDECESKRDLASLSLRYMVVLEDLGERASPESPLKTAQAKTRKERAENRY